MIKVVIDTNVFISSFFGGNPKKIVDLWKKGEIKLCLSREIVDEYVEVLKRLGLQNESELRELLNTFAEGHNIIFSASTPSLNIIEQDPDDNMFIECAVALECSHIISGDKHLKSVKNYMGIKIVNPKEFLIQFQTIMR
ncbi:MAG: putative toxin-antitoxin system toxin component, PIN family [Deltaproteobacteria bacterium]|nr:MAG: putative toxin-antitoxin system toxin component, PIN family [Deltaproteobacteria bacterium]